MSRLRGIFLAISLLAAAVAAVSSPPAAAQDNPAGAQALQPLPIKAVVVTMFEIGEDTGDRLGEFQTWVERLPLPEKLPFPQGYRDLRYNPEKGVLGIVTGIGTAKS